VKTATKFLLFCMCFCAAFIAYMILVAISAVWLIFYASRRWGNTNPLIYVTITGTIGSLTVMSCKGLGVGIKQTLTGTSQLTNPALWIILVIVVTCITVQVRSFVDYTSHCCHLYYCTGTQLCGLY